MLIFLMTHVRVNRARHNDGQTSSDPEARRKSCDMSNPRPPSASHAPMNVANHAAYPYFTNMGFTCSGCINFMPPENKNIAASKPLITHSAIFGPFDIDSSENSLDVCLEGLSS